MTALFLGIDTGGTFTDGVLLEPELRAVVKSAKVLTTHHNLKLCISQVLDQLLPADPAQIRMVSLSTTLATNAIVEGKSRPVGLFLLGYDPALVYQYEFHRQFGTDQFFFIAGGMDMQGREQAPLDETAIAGQAAALQEKVEAFAVSSYAGTMNADHEERAADLLDRLCGLPVVQGHQLTSRLNSIRRATTASLNAGLLSTAVDFLNTVREMLCERQIHCPLVVVKGDGSLVSADFAAHRPVEIIHSGPATSAIGGLYLANAQSALVIDIGGTTTDLALLQNGKTILDDGEATVGGYHTSVRTIRARSFGLGGDSHVRFDPRSHASVGPERVIPLAYLAHTYPAVKKELEAFLVAAPDKFYSDKLEFWMLRREPRQPFDDPRTRRVLELLRDGPRRMSWLLKQVGAKTPVQVDAAHLIRQDIIARAGLTPTDLLHVTGEYAPWDAGIPRLAVEAAARMWGVSPAQWIEIIRRQMTEKIVAEIIRFLSGHSVPVEESGLKEGSLARWMFNENMAGAHPFLGCNIRLKIPLIGIGAPARAFLEPVAEALGTEMVFPEHYEVANAVGTVVANVLIRREAEVLPLVSGPVITGYAVHVDGRPRSFERQSEALDYAREMLNRIVRDEAASAGAGDVAVLVEEEAIPGMMVRVTAQAVGKPASS